MAFYTDGVVPWNSLDDNTRAPLASELEGGYPCGEADQQLFNWTAGWSIGNIWNMILQSGITPDTDKLLDLARAIQSGKVNYAVAGGTANALTASLSPVPSALTVGMVVRIKAPSTNSSTATLNLNGFGPSSIVRPDGTALAAGDINALSTLDLVWTGTAWMMLGRPLSQSATSVRLFAASDSLIVPAGASKLFFQAWGAGGGGGGTSAVTGAAASGGGGGQYRTGGIAVVGGETLSIIVGLAGSGGGGGGANNGTSGGNTQIIRGGTPLVTAVGGAFGFGSSSGLTPSYGAGGTGGSGGLALDGDQGELPQNYGGVGPGLVGGRGGATYATPTRTIFGDTGGGALANGAVGRSFGGGGCGGRQGGSGGQGGDGFVSIILTA